MTIPNKLTSVLYYSHADDIEPSGLAIVTNEKPNDLLDLLWMPPGRTPIALENIRPKGDPSLKRSPGLRMEGAWDIPPKPPQATAPKRPPKQEQK